MYLYIYLVLVVVYHFISYAKGKTLHAYIIQDMTHQEYTQDKEKHEYMYI